MKTSSTIRKLAGLFLMFSMLASRLVVPASTTSPPSTIVPTEKPTPAPIASPLGTATYSPAPVAERSYTDRPDDFPGLYQVHLLYVLPAEATDQRRDLDGKINISIEDANQWFFEQSGGSK